MSSSPLPKKALGQHWLEDVPTLQAIVGAAEVTNQDYVLEIGPGLGTLTRELVAVASEVLAVEFDEHLAMQLPARVRADNLEIVTQDILKFDFGELPTGYKVVANIPYYLTSNLIRVLSETVNPPVTAVLLVQKEVAERVAARPGDLSILGVTAQFYWQVSLGQLVPAELFTPPPKVDSKVLIMHARTVPMFPDVVPKDFFRIVKAGFGQKRKTLLNSLSSGLSLSREVVQQACAQAGIDTTRRAQTLRLEEWYELYQQFNT